MRVRTDTIATCNVTKYLGQRLERKVTFWKEIRAVCGNAAKVTSHLSGLAANVEDRRPVDADSGCLIRADALTQVEYRKQMSGV